MTPEGKNVTCLPACNDQLMEVSTTSSTYPAQPVFHELPDFCLLVVKLLYQCNNEAENAAISRKYPNICPGILTMEDDFGAIFSR
jgi:hypothetical protein